MDIDAVDIRCYIQTQSENVRVWDARKRSIQVKEVIMPRGKLSDEAKKAIGDATRARWARYRNEKSLGSPISLGGKPGRKRKATGKRRGRPPGSKNAVTVSMSSAMPVSMPVARMTGGEFGHQSTGALVDMRRKIDLELADRFVRDYVG